MHNQTVSLMLVVLILFSFATPAAGESLIPFSALRGVAAGVGDWDREWEILGAGIAGTLTLIVLDGELYSIVQAGKTPASDWVARFIGPLGGGSVAVPGLLLGYGLAGFRDDPTLGQAVQEAWESLLISGLIVTVGKQLTHRQRPSHGEDPYKWGGPGISREHLSFPSGHSAAAFSIATSFAGVYGEDRPWVSYLAYSLAALAAYSRIHDSHHWPSDVFAGSLLGWAVGRQVRNFHEEREEAGIWTIDPAGGVLLSWEWTF